MKDESLSALMKALLSPSSDDVWTKALYCGPVNERNGFRKDDHGNWIKKDHYGRRDSKYGWEIDHTIPSSRGGHDGLSNSRPLQWEANVRKSDLPPGLFSLADLFSRKGGGL